MALHNKNGTVHMTSYSLGINELDELIGEIKSGTNLMIIGPPMSGKNEVINSILYTGLQENNSGIIVSTGDPGEKIIEWFEENDLSIENSPVGIVDCVTKTLGLGAPDTYNIKRVASPVDLTGIGVKISHFFDEFMNKQNIQQTRLCINSLSTILMYSNIQTVFRFLHVFTGRVKSSNSFGLYVVEDEMHDARTIATLKQLFDGMIEIKTDDEGQNYIRVVGITSKPTPWYEFEFVGSKISLKKVDKS
ncbi:RAD55 family ATPase [Methanosalsum natronophilum]|nr:ATPase domain-containing protein [Methanosalsum natronophilum]